MKVSIYSSIGLALLIGFIASMSTAAFFDLQRVKFCEYAQKFSKEQNDIMLSQHATGYENLELVQCDGRGKIVRDDKNQVQNFTFFFPKGKYRVNMNDVGKITNVVFTRPK